MATDTGDLPDPQGETDDFLRKLVEKIDTSALAQNIAKATEILVRSVPGETFKTSDLPYTDVDRGTVPLGARESEFTPNDLFAGLDVLLNKYLGVRPVAPEGDAPTIVPSSVPLPPIPLPPIPLPPKPPSGGPSPAYGVPPAPGGPTPSGAPKVSPGDAGKREWTPADLLYGLDALFRKYFAPKPGGPSPVPPSGPGAPPPSSTPPHADMDALFKKYFGKKHPIPMGKREKDSSIGRGIGNWAKAGLRSAFRGSKINRWKWAGKRAGAGLGRSLGMEAGGTARLAGAAGAAGAAAGVVAIVVAAVVAVVVAFIKARDAVDKWTDQALATARRLAEYSGSMAVVTAERDIMQMMRDVKRGEATAGSARGLVHAEAGRKEEENRIAIVVDNATNNILTVLNDIIGGVLRPIADTMEVVDEAVRKWLGKPKEVGVGGLAATLDDVADAARKADARGRDLMAIAREAAVRAGGPGGAAPSGAAPRGRLP